MYHYNITPKDHTSASTALANGIYTYQVQVKGIDVGSPPACKENTTYKIGAVVSMKAPRTICMSKFGKWVVTRHHGLRSILVKRTPCDIRYLRSAKGVDHDGPWNAKVW